MNNELFKLFLTEKTIPAIIGFTGAIIGSLTTLLLFTLKEILEYRRRTVFAKTLLKYHCTILVESLSTPPDEISLIDPIRLEPYTDIYIKSKNLSKLFSDYNKLFIKWKKHEVHNQPIEIRKKLAKDLI